MYVGKSFEESVCLSCRHYLVTKIIQLDSGAAERLNYTSRVELVSSDNIERSKLVVQLRHPISTVNTVLASKCKEITTSIAKLLSPSRREGLDNLRCSTKIPFWASGRRQQRPCEQLAVRFFEGECDVPRSTISQS